MKRILITSVVALALILGSAGVAQAASLTLSSNLTIGSTGTEVSSLQQFLLDNGYDIPALSSGAAMKGYFGQQTKAAVIKYQLANNVIGTGFVGPLTRAALSGGASVGGAGVGTVAQYVANCPVGYTCPAPVANAGTVVTPVTPGVITTPGVEGTISATQSNAGLASTAYEGDKMVAILGFELEAKTSDISVQRVKVRLDELDGSDTKFYNKIYQKLYLTDGSTVLASQDLNTSTVVKDGSNYYVTFSGFNWVVPKDAKKSLIVKADLYTNIDSTDFDLENYQIGLAANGVRGVDGAGIDQFAGGSSDNGIARETTIATTLTESATLTVSLNSASPAKNDVVAAAGSSENELDKLTLMSFNVKAEKDNVKVTDLNVSVTKSGSGAATANTAYIYEGITEIDSATITSGVATFSNFDQTILRDATRIFTVKADIRSADGTIANFVASTSNAATAFTAENVKGDTVTVSGSALGKSIGVRNRGPEITLVSKSLVASGAPQNNGTTTNVSTSTMTANFTFKVKAVGGSVMFGLTQATGTPFFASTTPALGGAKSFTIYVNGVENTTIGSYATSTSFTFDSACVLTGTNSCELPEGSETLVSASVNLMGRTQIAALSPGLYSFGINSLNWGGTNSTFMDDETTWSTNEVSFP